MHAKHLKRFYKLKSIENQTFIMKHTFSDPEKSFSNVWNWKSLIIKIEIRIADKRKSSYWRIRISLKNNYTRIGEMFSLTRKWVSFSSLSLQKMMMCSRVFISHFFLETVIFSWKRFPEIIIFPGNSWKRFPEIARNVSGNFRKYIIY